jgi:hypothetical protein
MLTKSVRRMKNDPNKWEWRLRDGDYSDSCKCFDTVEEARADLAREMEAYWVREVRAEDERAFWAVAFG